MGKRKKGVKKIMDTSPADRTSDATPITREELDALMAMLRKLTGAEGAARTPTIREQRAQEHPPAPTLRSYGLEEIPEPRRQRKERHMAPRNVYSAKKVLSAETLHAVQALPPASIAILVYLAAHPRTTIPTIVAELDIRRKTVENALSRMGQLDLVISERR